MDRKDWKFIGHMAIMGTLSFSAAVALGNILISIPVCFAIGYLYAKFVFPNPWRD